MTRYLRGAALAFVFSIFATLSLGAGTVPPSAPFGSDPGPSAGGTSGSAAGACPFNVTLPDGGSVLAAACAGGVTFKDSSGTTIAAIGQTGVISSAKGTTSLATSAGAGAPVVVSAGSPPVAGQTLVATSPTAAAWTTPSGSIPHVWPVTNAPLLRWNATNQTTTGLGNNPIGPSNWVSEGSNTIGTTLQFGNSYFPAATKMAGKAFFPFSSGNGYKTAPDAGAHPAADSDMTVLVLMRFVTFPTNGFYGIYLDKCYYYDCANSPPYGVVQLYLPAGASSTSFTVGFTVAGTLNTIDVPLPTNQRETMSSGAGLWRGDVMLFFIRWTHSTALLEAGYNGVVYTQNTLGSGNIDWGSDGPWMIGSDLARSGANHVPWDEIYLFEVYGSALSDATLRQYWEIANFGSSQ